MARYNREESTLSSQKRVLCVGLVCLDFKAVVSQYPGEDTNQRTSDTLMERGGNASNSASVLSFLGCNVEFIGTISNDENKSFLVTDFKEYGVRTDNVVFCENSKCPMSIVIVNSENGSRTILHSNRTLRELSIKEFKLLDLSTYHWIHFEGRPNDDNIRLMIKHILDYNTNLAPESKITISLEFEKIRTRTLEDMIPLVDFAFFSKDFAKHIGHNDMISLVKAKCDEINNTTVICAWGDQGAAAKRPNCDPVTSGIYPPDEMVDTTGAGDTFNAGFIYSIIHNRTLEHAIKTGCCLAGTKCGIMGLKDLQCSKSLVNILKSNV